MSERLDKIEKIMEQMNIDASIRLEEDKERKKEEDIRLQLFDKRFNEMILEDKERKKNQMKGLMKW